MHDDDVIARYEEEFDEPARGRRRANRGFWMIAITMILGAMFLLVEIFAHRPIANDISRTQHDLNEALARAESIRAGAGSFAGADAAGLTRTDDDLSFVGPDERSAGPGEISVYASSEVWAASVRAQTGTCFSLKRTLDGETTYLIADGACTGREALSAVDDRW